MFNNDAINVVLGLIFVFLIYSLLASILMESFARKMGLRARMLLKAISKVLDDSEFKKESYVIRAFWSLLEPRYFDPFKKRSFTALFYSHPNIINLGRNSFSSKPSYISDEVFSETVIQILRGDEFKGQQNQIELIKNNLKIGVEGEGCLPLPSYYIQGSKTTTAYNLVKIKELAGDNKEFIKLHPHTLYQIKQTLFDSHQDIDWFKTQLKKWYNETIDRAQGWYTRQTRTVLLYLGLLIAVSFNVDCIEIGKQLSIDKELRNKVAEMATIHQQNPDQAIKDSSQKVLAKVLSDANSVKNILSANKSWEVEYKGKPFTWLWDAFLRSIGWILTAIAISLGASFWFDLLKRIMAIRTAGEKPKEIKPTTVHITEDAIG